MKKLFKSVLIALGLFPGVLLADAASTPDFSTELLEESRGIAQFEWGEHPGGQIDALMPFYGDDNEFLYTDLQAYQFGSQYQTLSAGMGARALRYDAVYGAYGFYDYQTLNDNYSYNRYNFGLERFDGTWEVRTNFYYYGNAGVENVTDQGQTSVFIQDTNIDYNHLYDVEKAYTYGGDIEVGRTLGLDALRGYVAYYNYGNVINGGRVRASYDLDDRWQLVGSGQYDAARGWLAYGGVNYWIGKTQPHTGTAIDHMRDPIVRDMTIGVKKINSYNEIDTDTRNIYFTSPTGSNAGTGTQNDPMSIDAAVARSKAGDFIYLEKGTQDYALLSAIHLSAGQTLWGGGANLNIMSAQGKTFLLKPASGGAAPVLNAGATTLSGFCGALVECAIYVDQTSSYGGFTLNGESTQHARQGFQIAGSNTINVDISDITVQNFNFTGVAQSSGIRVENTGMKTAVTLTSVTSNNNYYGLRVDHGMVTVDKPIAGRSQTSSNFNNNVGTGVLVGGDSTIGTVTDAVVNLYNSQTNSNFEGIYAQYGGEINLYDSTISNNTDVGVNADGANSQINIYGASSITNNTSAGFYATNNSNIDVYSGAIISGNASAQIWADSGAIINVTSPTTLVGGVQSFNTGIGGTIHIDYNGTLTTFGPNTFGSCNISGGMGDC